jgi:cellulose synthase/poly-beta-1,6-N-acetylglucosamine synthase-like glycosyltransferase
MTAPLLTFAALIVSAAVSYLIVVAAASVAGALARGARRERAVDSYEALAVSRFTIPVSIIVPVESDDAPVSRCIAGLLGLDYPGLEIIVVSQGLSRGRIAWLKEEWSLEAKEFFYRRTLATAPIHRIYGSARYPSLTIVDKAPGGRADALNCGVNVARYRYVVSVAPDVRFDPHALLRLISPALRDPATVLAVTSYVERRAADDDAAPQGARPFEDYQRLSSIRSWMASRLAWHQLRCGVPPREGVVAWRRDAVLDLGGFSTRAADAELDLLSRLQVSRTERTEGRVVRTAEVFGHADATSLAAQAKTSARRQRALLGGVKTLWHARNAGAERVVLMVVLAVELITPAAQVLVLASALIGALTGWVRWTTPFAAVLMLCFGYAVVSASALLLRGGAPEAPTGRDLVRLLVRAPLEFAVYRPALAVKVVRN